MWSSAKTVAEYKHLEVSEVECDAAIALINKNENVKAERKKFLKNC